MRRRSSGKGHPGDVNESVRTRGSGRGLRPALGGSAVPFVGGGGHYRFWPPATAHFAHFAPILQNCLRASPRSAFPGLSQRPRCAAPLRGSLRSVLAPPTHRKRTSWKLRNRQPATCGRELGPGGKSKNAERPPGVSSRWVLFALDVTRRCLLLQDAQKACAPAPAGWLGEPRRHPTRGPRRPPPAQAPLRGKLTWPSTGR